MKAAKLHLRFVTLICLFWIHCLALNANPQVQYLNAAQRTDATKMVDIYFNIIHNRSVTVSIYASQDNGVTWNLLINQVSGDVGPNIVPGNGKHIVWDVTSEHPNIIYENVKFKVKADDAPQGFVSVPGGTFTMGRSTGTGDTDELPVHQVTLSSFYISKYEVTQSDWQNTMGTNPSTGHGVGSSYPVYNVSWYAAIKYCNLKSVVDGLTPSYSINGSTNTSTWGSVPTSNNSTWNSVVCNWSANGYRLPTEAEWEYTSRGTTNNPDYLYSGSNDASSVAWYSGNSSSSTQPVGQKQPNSLGVYDLSGNLYEWCWDWWGSSYYSSSAQNNPIGPTSGSSRVGRGGCWNNEATGHCRVANRGWFSPYSSYDGVSYVGFRICRSINNNMVFVSGGTFTMGRTIGSGEGIELPTHQATLSSFLINKSEVTQAEYSLVMGSNPSYFQGNLYRPVEQVNWYSAIAYCNKRSLLEGFTPCYTYSAYGTNPDNWPVGWNIGTHNNLICNWNADGYRLPTEAEWEYAARGAVTNPDFLYAGSNDLNTVAWYNSNSGSVTHTVGLKQANNLGLYDMSGNVWEWCWDWYDIYTSDNQLNPNGPSNGIKRVIRGAAYVTSSNDCRIAIRSNRYQYTNDAIVGFRVCRISQ